MDLFWWIFSAALLLTGLVAYGALCPQSRLLTRVLWRGPRTAPPQRPRIALTFDDGPDPLATEAILDTLRALDAPATFFVIGMHAQRHPEVIRRLNREGHLIGNHTFDHSHLGMFRAAGYWRDQIERTSTVIEATIGQRPAMFRPPMGFKQGFIAWAAWRGRCRVITWSRRGRDGWPTTPEKILQRLVPGAQDGDILTLHDGNDPGFARDPAATIAVIEPLILALRERGFEIVRLDALLGLPGYQVPPALNQGAARES